MKVKALCSFAGAISMAKGEVRDCEDPYIVDDLLSCGYVEAVETPSPEEPPAEKKPRKRTVKADENK